MIRHQAIRHDTNASLDVGFSQDLLKCGVVSGFLKQREPPDTTVQDMIREVSSSKAMTARHGDLLPKPRNLEVE